MLNKKSNTTLSGNKRGRPPKNRPKILKKSETTPLVPSKEDLKEKPLGKVKVKVGYGEIPQKKRDERVRKVEKVGI